MSDPLFKRIFNLIYPIGSIYLSVNSTSPAVLFGGTWVQLKDKFLLGAGNTYTNGKTGGEATHKLIASEIPEFAFQTGHIAYGEGMAKGITNVTHTFVGNQGSSSIDYEGAKGTGQGYAEKFNFGGNQAHNNMPPYLVVYMWKRTA